MRWAILADASTVRTGDEIGLFLIMGAVIVGVGVGMILYLWGNDYRELARVAAELRGQVQELSAGQVDLKDEILTMDDSLKQAGERYAELAGEYQGLRQEYDEVRAGYSSDRNHWQRTLIDLETERDEWKTRAEGLAQDRDNARQSRHESEIERAEVIQQRDEAIAERGRVEDSYRKALALHSQAMAKVEADRDLWRSRAQAAVNTDPTSGLAQVKSFNDTAIEFYEGGGGR